MPELAEVDIAILERMIVLHFPVTFLDLDPGEQPTLYRRQRDNNLKDKIKADKTGVFNWLVKGAVAWYAAQDLKRNAPLKVKEFSRGYLEEQDRLMMFIKECCTTNQGDRVSTVDLIEAFRDWSEENVTSRWFVPAMAKKGFAKKTLRLKGVQTKCFDGITLRSDLIHPSDHDGN